MATAMRRAVVQGALINLSKNVRFSIEQLLFTCASIFSYRTSRSGTAVGLDRGKKFVPAVRNRNSKRRYVKILWNTKLESRK